MARTADELGFVEQLCGVFDSKMEGISVILAKGKVLLVDDEPLVLEMFESVLSQEGYDVRVAADAKSALLQLDKGLTDILVCDVKLDDFDGFDILSIARKKHPRVAVVLITGAPNDGDARRADGLNAAYLSKPIGFDLLLNTVEDALERWRTECAKTSADLTLE